MALRQEERQISEQLAVLYVLDRDVIELEAILFQLQSDDTRSSFIKQLHTTLSVLPNVMINGFSEEFVTDLLERVQNHARTRLAFLKDPI